MTQDASFAGKLAVVTGGGSGISRELIRQLAAQGCSVAACDRNAGTVEETAAMARTGAPDGVVVTSHVCDPSDEAQVQRFRDELLAGHSSENVNLVFSNESIVGGASFVKDSREDWEHTFTTNWQGVYFCARTFLPLLIASGDGVLVNISSMYGFWAANGAGMPNSGYATSEFAIKGFTESLVEDLRTNAPQVRVVLVMPGHGGTDYISDYRRGLGLPDPAQMSDAQLAEYIPAEARAGLVQSGLLAEDASADDLRQLIANMGNDLQDKESAVAAEAATTILDGIRSGAWRILVGDDAKILDARVREDPDDAYNYEKLFGDMLSEAQASGTPEP
jgi:NAD(P)-dependent dehydrogenase (short-subunit alcohol dehydrogenase family)